MAEKNKGVVFVENKNSFETIFYDEFPQQDEDQNSIAHSKTSSIRSNRRIQGSNTSEVP